MPTLTSIGLIAPEFPPMVGGMSELARGVCLALSDLIPTTVVIPSNGVDAGLEVTQAALLVDDIPRDAAQINEIEVDAWLALNAGLAPLAAHVRKPLFLYLHGNDFLTPWLACGPWWIERIRRPYVAAVRNPLRRRAVRRFSGQARHLFCNSRKTAQLIEDRLGAKQRFISVVPPGVDDDFFQESGEKKRGPLRVLSVSSLSTSVPRKNIDGVLRAVKLLTSEMNIQYTVVGGGDDIDRLERLAVDLDLGQTVEFKGPVSKNSLLACYREADLFVLASKASTNDVEGFGIVYIEASASGVPVICSREGGAVDAVVEGQNGLIIDSSDPNAIADGIRQFIRRRSVLTPQRARLVAEDFRWSRVAATILAKMEALSQER